MVGWPEPALARACARLAALALLLASLLPGTIASSRAFAAGCNGDEQILLVPAEPAVGGQLMVLVVSRYAHEDVLLLGPDGPLEVKRWSNGDRYVWQATLVPDRAGEHLFAFGVAGGAVPLVTCADARAQVSDGAVASAPSAGAQPSAESSDDLATGDPAAASALVALLNPYGRAASLASAPDESSAPPLAPSDEASDSTPTATGDADPGAPQPTDTRRPTRTPTRRPVSSVNGNANDNGNENGNDNDGDPTPTSTPTLTRTPTPGREPTETRTPTPTREPTATRTPRPDPSDTPGPLATDEPPPTATRTPRPDPTDTPVRSPTPTRTPRPDPTDTPSPTATPTLAPPSIAGWAPDSAMCGQSLTIRGERFGANRQAVDGRVTVDGRDTEVLAWGMTQVTIKVPLTARPGNDRELMMIVAEHVVTSAKLRISC